MENDQKPTIKPVDNNPGFVTKVVETPILDSNLRRQIGGNDFGGNSSKSFFKENKFYFLAIVLGVAIISILSYLAFKKPATVAPKEANVDISVDVPETVASGGEAVYKITIKNNDSQKLINSELELVYPDGFTYMSSVPNAENISGTKFKVPDLVSGQNATVMIKAKASGNVNDEKKLSLKLHYSYANFTSEFIKDQVSVVRLVASDVLVELSGPQTANNAEIVVYTAKYQNNSDSDVKNTRIKITYPAGFVFASADPTPAVGTDTWNIGTLAQGASGQIQIQGSFTSVNPGEAKTATAEFIVLDSNGQAQTQNSSIFTTTISTSPLLVSQELEPASPNGVVKPGDNLTYRIRYQNNASTAATGVNIVVTLDSRVINLSSLRAEGGQVNNNTILWNASTVPNLENLAPNESGQLSFSLQLNNPAVKDSAKNLTVISNIKIKSNEYGAYFSGNALTLKVSSPSTASSYLSFVSGQLPPQVGKQSVYKVKLSLNNSTNDFTDGVVTAFIPLGPNSLVPGSYTTTEASNASYDSSTGKLTWNVGALPANTGKFAQSRVLEFQVKFNPSASQVNQSPTLVKSINFMAKDSFTGENISVSANDLTTNDVEGVGFGNGTVGK
ncbi:MAG: hypothetical protein WC794_04930 [Candidatus Doudnabacteria bacterium]|jgi:uncharacterized repeat protein (TIGR01451 family)